MKKLSIALILLLFSAPAFSQVSQHFSDSVKKLFDKEYLRLQPITQNHASRISVKKNAPININNMGDSLKNLLVLMERPTEFDRNISSATRELISNRDDPYMLVLIERSVKEDKALDQKLHLKEKLLKELSIQINLLTKNKFPYYNYNTKEKQLIKFVSVRSGNDLFTVAGLYAECLPKDRHIKDNNILFQRNDDRDYTGSLLVEIATDYMKFLRRRPLKTYQTLLYGFDVYTPYFRDTTIFKYDTSYNVLDRPHASFQYFGWSQKGISKRNKYRWETTLKFGKIGGSAGPKFQNALHQDISYSPRPKGWGAQIANGGRIGFSLECKEEWMLIPDKSIRANDWTNVNLSFFLEQKLGTYMTLGGIGIQLSNKNFAQNNQNFINHRIRQTTGFLDHFMYKIAFQGNYVVHNTMLEGYGMVSSKGEKGDALTPKSKYYLSYDDVRRMAFILNTTLSYTARFATVFYNWSSYSPETWKSNIGIKSPASGRVMNIANRWHHYAEIGFTFNVH